MQEVGGRRLASVDQEHTRQVRSEKGRVIAMAAGELESDTEWQWLVDAEVRCGLVQ